MKRIFNGISIALCAVIMGSCAKGELLDYNVTQTDSLAQLNYLSNYDVLKSYIDQSANPYMTIGMVADESSFIDKGITYRIAQSNFEEITPAGAIAHGNVIGDDGYIDLTTVKELINVANSAGLGIFGYSLIGNTNQNATYLYSLIDAVNAEDTESNEQEIVEAAMKEWIQSIVTACKGTVSEWSIATNIIDDEHEGALRHETWVENPGDDEFYWQDYVGDNFVAKALSYARAAGNSGDKFFICDYGLENADGKKLQTLLDFIDYTAQQGGTIDGIGADLYLTADSTDKSTITNLFKKLANTGKLIRINKLQVSMADGTYTADMTDEQNQKVADMYQFVIDAYITNIPAAQRYGITFLTPIDTTTLPSGLWTSGYNRKRAYAAVAEAL